MFSLAAILCDVVESGRRENALPRFPWKKKPMDEIKSVRKKCMKIWPYRTIYHLLSPKFRRQALSSHDHFIWRRFRREKNRQQHLSGRLIAYNTKIQKPHEPGWLRAADAEMFYLWMDSINWPSLQQQEKNWITVPVSIAFVQMSRMTEAQKLCRYRFFLFHLSVAHSSGCLFLLHIWCVYACMRAI